MPRTNTKEIPYSVGPLPDIKNMPVLTWEEFYRIAQSLQALEARIKILEP
jgi:hypothetical protein